MKKIVVFLVLAVAIIASGIFLARDYLKLSGIGNHAGAGKQAGAESGVSGANRESRTTHPRLEAHRLLEQKTPAAVVYEWIPYYYRHPRPQESVEVMEVLLSQETFDSAQMGELNHFFAAILHDHKEELEKLREAGQRYSGKQLETVTAVVKEAENYEAVKEVTPSSLDSLWAEYMATGEKEIITRMIQTLEPSKSNDDQRFVEAVQSSFYKYIPLFLDAHRSFHEARENASGGLRRRLEEMKKRIEESFVEPANMHLRLADNHIKQREYDPALDEFEESLEYYPDYQNVFINVANMYKQQGKLQEAFAAMKKAVQIDPNNSTACYGMGRHCYMQGKYDESISWYSVALRYHPKEPIFVHAIARSYQDKGDTANAVKYFGQYLQYAPNGEHVDLVKQYLVSVNVPVEESDSVFAAFKRKDFDALETQLAAILKEKKKDKNGQSCLADAYNQLCSNPDAKNAMEKWLGYFEEWLKRNPSSHFANAATGMFYIDYAMHARGDGWGNTITEEGGRLYEERLLKARGYLENAYLSDSSDPIVPSHLIMVANGLGSDEAEMEKQFQRAIRADSSEYKPYIAKLTYLMPKWHGTQVQMFSFARETARNAPADSLAPLVVANAHWEMYYRSENKSLYFTQREVWNEVKSIYSTLCQRFPESSLRHNWFARTAYLAGDFETAKQELAIIQDDWSEDAWGSYVGFTKAKEEILRK